MSCCHLKNQIFTGTTHPPTKKICYAEVNLDESIATLTEGTNKLEDILRLNKISNPEETCAAVKVKKTDLTSVLKNKNTLKRNRISQKLARERKKKKAKQRGTVSTSEYVLPLVFKYLAITLQLILKLHSYYLIATNNLEVGILKHKIHIATPIFNG